MTNFKWLRRTSSSQPDRRPARQFTPRVGGLEDRISLSYFGYVHFDTSTNNGNGNTFNGNSSFVSGINNSSNFLNGTVS